MNRSMVLSLVVIGLTGVACGKAAPVTSTTQLQATDRIIGGEAATESDTFAHSTVALYDTEAQGLCTATILSKNLLVTAAHCAQSPAKALKIIFALNAKSKSRVVLSVQSLSVNPNYAKTMDQITQMQNDLIAEEMKANPEFDPRKSSAERDALIAKIRAAVSQVNNWGDIALLKLDGEIPEGYKPAKILADKSAIQNGSSIVLAGYGITHPQTASPAHAPDSELGFSAGQMDTYAALGADTGDDILLRKVEVKVKDSNFSPSEVLLDQTQGKGACHGDSGGPAFSIVNGDLYVWGVTSRGVQDPGDTCGAYSAYTNMLAHTEWILQTAIDLGAEI